MELPNPHRYSFFPPSQIFGRKMVPVYYLEDAPLVPVTAIAGVLGVPPKAILNAAKKNLELAPLVDIATGELIKTPEELDHNHKSACAGMESICLLVFSLDPAQTADAEGRERLQVAKIWMAVQVANRLKKPGRRNQPRWDAGLNKLQSRMFKDRFAKLGVGKK
jgi:hypothetical protein